MFGHFTILYMKGLNLVHFLLFNLWRLNPFWNTNSQVRIGDSIYFQKIENFKWLATFLVSLFVIWKTMFQTSQTRFIAVYITESVFSHFQFFANFPTEKQEIYLFLRSFKILISNSRKHELQSTHGSRYSRIDQVKFVEGSL